MSLHPIRSAWYTRPGWSPYGAWRVVGTHIGFDHYTKAGTPIYATGNGRVASSGWHEGGHGHFVRIAYPGNVIVSYSHMEAPTPIPWSGSVTAGTRMGTVGDTGNAEGIFWMHPTAGKLLHVHTEVRISGKLVDPITYFNALDGALAGGDTTPITNPTTEMDERMILIKREDGGEWSLFHPSLDGGDDLQKGYIVTTSQVTARDWARTWADGAGSEKVENRDRYIAMQRAARTTHDAYRRTMQGIFGAPSGSNDLASVLEAIAKVPTATQNGQAARTAIVK